MENPIKIEVFKATYETDFGDRVSWRLPGWETSYEDETNIMRRAQESVDMLAKVGIPAEIVVTERKIPYPREW